MSDPSPAASSSVFVDYSQFQVIGGDEVGDPTDPEELPGVAYTMGPEWLVVLTGIECGEVQVSAETFPGPPPMASGWDSVAEIDLDSPRGSILVHDWAGPAHTELADLAAAGPGKYRLRMHSRHVGDEAAERHHLIAWPAPEPTPARLVISPGPPPTVSAQGQGDEVHAAAAAGVVAIVDGLRHDAAPGGPTATLMLEAEVAMRARDAYEVVAAPYFWVGKGAVPGLFVTFLNADSSLSAEGKILEAHKSDHVAFSWIWRRPPGSDIDGAVDPGHIDVTIVPTERRACRVRFSHDGVPAQLAPAVQALWQWAFQRMEDQAAGRPFRWPAWWG